MSLQLKIDEMLEAFFNLEHPHYQAYVLMAESLADLFARQLVLAIPDIEAGPATWEGLAFAGLCAPIRSTVPGAPIPEALQGLDDDGWDE